MGRDRHFELSRPEGEHYVLRQCDDNNQMTSLVLHAGRQHRGTAETLPRRYSERDESGNDHYTEGAPDSKFTEGS